MDGAHVHVSYCAPCGFKTQFDELLDSIKQHVPEAHVSGQEDLRSGAFEVSINGEIVHSRLSTLAFPDLENTAEAVDKAQKGEPFPKKLKQQPITDCAVS